MNRALQALPKGERVAIRGGLGVGPMTPLVMRGAAPVLGWAPQSLPKADEELAARVLDLYSHRDPVLAQRADARARHRPHGHRARGWRATPPSRAAAPTAWTA